MALRGGEGGKEGEEGGKDGGVDSVKIARDSVKRARNELYTGLSTYIGASRAFIFCGCFLLLSSFVGFFGWMRLFVCHI